MAELEAATTRERGNRETLSDLEGQRLQPSAHTRFGADLAGRGLVSAILSAEGMTCKVQRKGADGGVDIIAGSGVLGISSPAVIVRVKSQDSRVGSEVLDQLGGVVGQHQADHGLLVALGGLTAQAKAKVNVQQLKVAVWDAEEVLDRLLEHYEVMPDQVKRKIPLRKEWIIDESDRK